MDGLIRETTVVLSLDCPVRVCLTQVRLTTSGEGVGSVAVRGADRADRIRGNIVRSTPRRVIVVSLVIGMLAVVSACSSRSNDSTATNTTPPTSGGASSGAPANGQFGTITDPVCGPAPSSGSTTQTAAPVGATTGPNVLGVTPTAIRVGTISDPGFSGYPGLNQELFDASDVFVSWCNSVGGINGHKIQLDKLDAAVLNYKDVIDTACGQDFALVGGGGVLDSTGENDRLTCLLPNYPGYVLSSQARGSDLTVQATNGGSNSQVSFGLANYLQEKFPDAGQAVGYITGNVSTTVANKNQYQEAGASLGWKTVYDDQYNSQGEATWLPFAQGLKDKGAKGLYFVGSAQNLAKLLNALGQIDYKLAWVASSENMYDPALIPLGGPDLDVNNVYVNDTTTPFLSTEVPAINQYEQLFQQYLPNGLKNAALGLNSFASWLLFAQSAKACGDTITRACVFGNASHTTEFDGGGLSGKINPSTPEVSTQCFVPVVANSKGFTVINWNANDGPYNCDPANVFKLTGDYGQATTLASVGKSLSDLN